MTGGWVGAALPRKEDRRMLTGRGRFTGDFTRPGMLHAAFARSPFAAAAVGPIDAAAALELPGVAAVFTAADLGRPFLRAVLERDEFVPTPMPMLAGDEVRFAGEPVAVVLADDPYLAEDAAELLDIDWTPWPAITGIEAATAEGARQVHQELTGNCMVDLTMFESASLPGIFAAAPVIVGGTFTSARVAALPLEGRACVAEWDDRDDQLVAHVSTQVPHQVRSGIAQALGVAEGRIRVIAPDVGGGFGLKCVVGREEVVVAAAAMRLRRPVAWVEDRGENLTASFHGHEQRYEVRAAFDAGGRVLGLSADIDCDVGAYSAFAFTSAVEPLMASSELPGIYKVPAYRARGRAIATNKAPTAPYRGVSRPQIVLVMERIMEKAARALGLDPLTVRRRNMISPGEFPYTGVTGITYDEGSYLASLDLAEQRVTAGGWPAERDRLLAGGLLAGIGYSCFSERTAYGTPVMSQRRMRMTPGYDTAHVRMDPSGEVIVTTGTCAHGQGHETTFAQIVADKLGVHPAQVRLRQGDTDLAAYGWGTFGSRSIVIGGGAAGRAAHQVADQLRRVAAHLLEASPDDVELAGGAARIRGDETASIPIGELSRLAYFQTHRLPEELRYGLEARAEALLTSGEPTKDLSKLLTRFLTFQHHALMRAKNCLPGWKTVDEFDSITEALKEEVATAVKDSYAEVLALADFSNADFAKVLEDECEELTGLIREDPAIGVNRVITEIFDGEPRYLDQFARHLGALRSRLENVPGLWKADYTGFTSIQQGDGAAVLFAGEEERRLYESSKLAQALAGVEAARPRLMVFFFVNYPARLPVGNDTDSKEMREKLTGDVVHALPEFIRITLPTVIRESFEESSPTKGGGS